MQGLEPALLETVILDPSELAAGSALMASAVSSHPLGPEEEEFRISDEEEVADAAAAASSPQNRSREVQPCSSSADFLDIVVSEPQQEVESTSSLIPGGSLFVSYLITTRTDIPEYDGREFRVRRRFKDIVALADCLVERYRGLFIPSRPEKNTVESQIMDKDGFIEQRRLAIERYLRRLAAHPVLRKSEELRTFLVARRKLPLVSSLDVASRMLDGAAKLPKQLFGDSPSAINPEEVVHSARGGRDLLRLFKELRQSVTNDWGSTKPPVVEEDRDFLERRDKLRDYERNLLLVSQQADNVLKMQAALSSSMGELGLSFVRLGNFETQNSGYTHQRAYASNLRRAATTMLKASRLLKGASLQAEKHLGGFHEHLAVLQSANAAFAERNDALLTMQTLLSDIAVMNMKAEKHNAASLKVFGGDKGRNKKVEDLKESIRATEEACGRAENQYAQIRERNRMEFERIEQEKLSRLARMIAGFAHSQVAYAEKLSKEWAQFLDN